MKIAVKDLRPNPFRDLARYPIDQAKVDALVQSIKDTEFWDNLVARKDTNGGYELAYGVHRLRALKKAGVDEVDIPVRKISDTVMAKIMAHENQTEWSSSALVAQETVRSIVNGFAEGKIELPKCGSGDGGTGRYAPSFQKSGPSVSGRPETLYSAASLSKFLGGDRAGWPESKVEAILSTLAAIEKSLIDEEDLEGLSVHQAEAIARQTKRVVTETGKPELAKSIGKRLASGMRSGTGRPPGKGGKKKSQHQAITYHGAKDAADRMMGEDRRPDKPPKNLDQIVHSFLRSFAKGFTAHATKLAIMVKYRDHMPADLRRRLIGSLVSIIKEATALKDKLEAEGTASYHVSERMLAITDQRAQQ